MKNFVCLTLISFAFGAQAKAQSTTTDLQNKLTVSSSQIMNLIPKIASVLTSEELATVVSASMNMQEASKLLAALEAENNSSAKLDLAVEKVVLIQNLLGAYLGKKDMFAYDLKKGPVQVQVQAGAAFEQVIQKLPFLGSIGISGSLTINPGEEIVTQFNALKTEFYSALAAAAAVSKNDTRVCAAANWAENTKVRYPGGRSFGEEIIETRQIWNLQLDCR